MGVFVSLLCSAVGTQLSQKVAIAYLSTVSGLWLIYLIVKFQTWRDPFGRLGEWYRSQERVAPYRR